MLLPTSQTIAHVNYRIQFRISYLLALGAKRTAEVQRDARIGEAQAKMESGIKVRSAPSSCTLGLEAVF